MKAVIVSDTHIGEYCYGKVDVNTGLNTRLLDFLSNLDKSIDFAIEKKVDVYIIVGDIYRIKNPGSKIRKQFASRLARLISNRIMTVLVTGNHDMTVSSDGAHSMSEMQELSGLIDKLRVISEPELITIKKTDLYFLPFVNRSEQKLLMPEDFLKYQVEKVKEFNEALDSSKKSLFFGHFGVDKSVIGGSFDLDMSSNEFENKMMLSDFSDDWTKIYLGHIHKNQEFNEVARHVGSIGRVDFSEEKEKKGFYFYEDGDDEFIEIDDREFKTFELKLVNDNYNEELNRLMKSISKIDLTKSIVKIKVDVLQTYYTVIKLDKLESYLRSNSWHFAGTNVNVITNEVIDESVEKITSIDLPDQAVRKYVKKHLDRFSDIEDKIVERGCRILEIVKNEA